MSSSIAFDTYAFVKKLKDAGMPEEQARILAETHTELIEERLVTKRDLKELELRLTHALTVRIGGLIVVGFGILGAVLKIH
ncbi:MAG: DUF1640 domain-containing protein [Magnetococcales bacterium]|nr:DUF1640 domain-containing protein [Magnetococcales bacterium]